MTSDAWHGRRGQAIGILLPGVEPSLFHSIGDNGSTTMAGICDHLDQIHEVTPSSTEGCSDCLAIGARWQHLRLCLTCGHVGCCDSSPHRHASKHAAEHVHPIVLSFEPGEDWCWCYVDEVAFVVDGLPVSVTEHV